MAYRIAAIVCLVGAVWPLSGCSAARPVLKSVQARVLNADLNGVDLAFDVGVENRLPFPVKSSGGKYGLDIDGSPFLNWDQVPGLNLPARNVGTVTLPARVEFASLLKSFKALATHREIPYRLHGALVFPVMGKEFDLPFSYEGKMPGPADVIRGSGILGAP